MMVYAEMWRSANLLPDLFRLTALKSFVIEEPKESRLEQIFNHSQSVRAEELALLFIALVWIFFCTLSPH